MAAPVWVLSVDLQTKTATFQSGMAEAARSARSSFNEIRSAAKEGGEGVQQSALNVRSAIGLVDNTIRGAHAMAIADLVREFQHTAIVMAALPFAVTVAGIAAVAAVAVEVAEKIKEWREAQEKLNAEQTKFQTSVNESFNGLDNRILQAGVRADELRNDHLGALRKELELIDHASMADLVKELETIAKAADPVFKMLEGHWYTLGIGSAGASHALDQFKTHYDALLSQGKDKDASDLLRGTLESAQKVLEAQKAMASSRQDNGPYGKAVDYAAQYQARAVLQAAGVGYTEKEAKAQETLVQALNAQITAEGKIAELKKVDTGNATKQVSNQDSARRAEAARAAAASELAIGEQKLTADKAMADARLEIQNASGAARLASDTAFADRSYALKIQANQAETAALDKSGKDYQNQLKALQGKSLELDAQHATAVAQLRSRADVEQHKRDLSNLEQAEREKIGATDQGSAERLAAIASAMRQAEALGLKDTDYYRQLGMQKVETTRQAEAEATKLKADAGREAADHTLKLGEIQLAAEKEQNALRDSGRRVSDAERLAEQSAVADQEFQIKRQALQQEAAALDTGAKDYENKLKAIQDKEIQLIRQHENEKTQIQNQATIARNQRIAAAYGQLEQSIARSTTSMLMGQISFAAMMNAIGSQVVSGIMQNAIQSALADDFTKEKDASAAARKAFLAGQHFPFPANLIMPEVLAAGAFASVMAFNTGTDAVPGVGSGDTVPSMLTPGEGVVPGGVMDGLRNVARNGGFDGGGQTVHVHVKPVYNLQALDGDGIDSVLKKHTSTLTKHFNNVVRRGNK